MKIVLVVLLAIAGVAAAVVANLEHRRADQYAGELEAAWVELGAIAGRAQCGAALAPEGAPLAQALQDVASCAAQRAFERQESHHQEPTIEPHAEARL